MESNETINGTGFNDEFDWYEYYLKHVCIARRDYIFRMVIFGLFVLFGVVGNAALIFIILKDKQLRNAPNILICNLAIADLLFIMVNGPVRIENEIHPCWLLGRLPCALKNYAPAVCNCACVYSLVALSRERFSAIVHGIHAHKSKQVKRTVFWTLISWVFGFVFAAPYLSKHFSFIYMGINCTYVKYGSLSAKVYEMCRMIVLYIIPLVVISTLYIIMAKTLIKSTKKFRRDSIQLVKQVQARKKLAYLSITLSIFFGLFWLPCYVYTLMYHFTSLEFFTGEFVIKFRLFHYYMSLANSSLNPWLIFIMSSSHRNRLTSCLGYRKMTRTMSSFRSTTANTIAYEMSTNAADMNLTNINKVDKRKFTSE